MGDIQVAISDQDSYLMTRINDIVGALHAAIFTV